MLRSRDVGESKDIFFTTCAQMHRFISELTNENTDFLTLFEAKEMLRSCLFYSFTLRSKKGVEELRPASWDSSFTSDIYWNAT